MRFQFIANDDTSAFSIQAKLLIRQLTKMGYDVIRVDLSETPDTKIKVYDNFKPDVVVFWTLFYDYDKIFPFADYIKKHENPYVVVFEVSDTDELSPLALSYIDYISPNIIITPSRWSANGFRNIKTPIVVIPHAIPFNEEDINNDKPFTTPYKNTVLLYAQHSPERKGVDIALPITKHTFRKRKDFFTIIKTLSKTNWIIKYTTFPSLIIEGFLDTKTYYSLFKLATHFFYPVRGGAFEIPILEALALGQTVIIPEKGAWVDIPLSKDDAYWIRVTEMRRYWFDNKFHIGKFVEPDVNDAKEKLDKALDEPLNPNVKEYFKVYSPDQIARLFLDAIKK